MVFLASVAGAYAAGAHQVGDQLMSESERRRASNGEEFWEEGIQSFELWCDVWKFEEDGNLLILGGEEPTMIKVDALHCA